MTIKAIILDVDGTLADTEDAHRIAFNKAFAKNHLSWNWDVALYGKLLKVTGGKERIKYFVESFLPSFAKPADYDGFVKHLHLVKTGYYTAMLADGHIPLRPGIKQLIDDARAGNIQLAISTTTSPENATDGRNATRIGSASRWYTRGSGDSSCFSLPAVPAFRSTSFGSPPRQTAARRPQPTSTSSPLGLISSPSPFRMFDVSADGRSPRKPAPVTRAGAPPACRAC